MPYGLSLVREVGTPGIDRVPSATNDESDPTAEPKPENNGGGEGSRKERSESGLIADNGTEYGDRHIRSYGLT